MEIMVACSAMAAAKEEAQAEHRDSDKSTWSKWKRGGIIGAAAVTGGTLLAITGGIAFHTYIKGNRKLWFHGLCPYISACVVIFFLIT